MKEILKFIAKYLVCMFIFGVFFVGSDIYDESTVQTLIYICCFLATIFFFFNMQYSFHSWESPEASNIAGVAFILGGFFFFVFSSAHVFLQIISVFDWLDEKTSWAGGLGFIFSIKIFMDFRQLSAFQVKQANQDTYKISQLLRNGLTRQEVWKIVGSRGKEGILEKQQIKIEKYYHCTNWRDGRWESLCAIFLRDRLIWFGLRDRNLHWKKILKDYIESEKNRETKIRL